VRKQSGCLRALGEEVPVYVYIARQERMLGQAEYMGRLSKSDMVGQVMFGTRNARARQVETLNY
jgi:hypothetical protein